MTSKKYKCKISSRVKLITSALIIVFLLLVFQMFVLFGSFISVLVFVVLALVTIYLYSNLPRSLEIHENAISINYPFRKSLIPYSQLIKVSRVGQLPVFRVGSQGYFGYIGKSMDGAICRIADQSDIIMLESQNTRLLFSCEKSDEFISEVRRNFTTGI